MNGRIKTSLIAAMLVLGLSQAWLLGVWVR